MASALGPGRECKCVEEENNDNVNKKKQTFVQSTNLKSIVLVSFKSYVFMANLTWNDTGKLILLFLT